MDIVERLREDAEYHRMVSYDADCSPEATINHKHHVNALDAAAEIERLRKENQTFKEAIIRLLSKDVEHVKIWPALKEKE